MRIGLGPGGSIGICKGEQGVFSADEDEDDKSINE
jgi:hypothetical protein